MYPGISRREALRLGSAVGLGVTAGIGAWPASSFARTVSPAGGWASSLLPRQELQALLEDLLAKYGLPGAVVGISGEDGVTTAAAGTGNLNTDAAMTPDTGFLTGSITKVWTATLVMTLVDDGLIDLDAPLLEYLPHLRLGDPDAARLLTPKHLLNHSSGIDAGDYLLELGEGPDAHQRYVEALASVGQVHAPGAYASYCNGGFILAGHLAEWVTGDSWGVLLHDRVIEPMGLRRTVTDTDAAILHRTAVGNVPDPESPGGHMATSKFLLPKSAAPAGSTLITTVEDNLAFARMHMRVGTTDNGKRVLTQQSARAMVTRTIDRPTGPEGGFGLGWSHFGEGETVVIRHGGGSNGGVAQLIAIPAARVGFCAFCNSSNGLGFLSELEREVLADVAIVPETPALSSGEPRAVDVDWGRFLGTFRRKTSIVNIAIQNGRLMLENRSVDEEREGTAAYSIGQPTSFEVFPVSNNKLVTAKPVVMGSRPTLTFLEPDASGSYLLLYFLGRLARRVA